MAARASTPPASAREALSPSPSPWSRPERSTPKVDPRKAALDEAAAQAFGRHVFEDTSRDSGLLKFHERAKEAGLESGTVERAYGQPEHRQELLEKLVQRWEEADLRLRDDWLVTIMWMTDRVRLRKRVAADKKSPGCRSLDSVDAQEKDLWAAALMVLKMSEAETQLDRTMKSVVVRLARGSLQAQRPGWPVDRASMQRMWDDISKHEMIALRRLEWKTATPSPPDLLAWLATDLTSSAQLLGMWRLHKPLAGPGGAGDGQQTLEVSMDGTVVLREVADPSTEELTDGTAAPSLELRRGKLHPAHGACGACSSGELSADDGFVHEVHWQQADCAPLLVKLHSPAGPATPGALPGLLLQPRGPDGDAGAVRADGVEQAPNSAWQGLQMGRAHETREPLPGQPQTPSCCNPLYPRFVLLAQYLVQLGLVCAPLEEIYGEEVAPAALPLAALRLSLGAFGAPPPEPCGTRLEELLGKLLRPAEVRRLPRLEACLHRLWSDPGGSAVARLWRRRFAHGITGLDVAHGPKPVPLPPRRPLGACLRCAALAPETPRSKGPDAQMATPAKGAASLEVAEVGACAEAQPLGAALQPKSGQLGGAPLRRLRRVQPADPEGNKENVPPARGPCSPAAAAGAPAALPPAERAEPATGQGLPLGLRTWQQPGASFGTPPTDSRPAPTMSPHCEAGGASDRTSPSIYSNDLGSQSSAIYEDAPTSEGGSQRSAVGGQEEDEAAVSCDRNKKPAELDSSAQAGLCCGPTASGQAATAAAAAARQQQPKHAEGLLPSPPAEAQAAPAAAGAPPARQCHNAPRGTPVEPLGVKRQGSQPPGAGQLDAKRPRFEEAKRQFTSDEAKRQALPRASMKRPAAVLKENRQERPDALALAEAEAQRVAATLGPRYSLAQEFMQQHYKEPVQRVDIKTLEDEAEASEDSSLVVVDVIPHKVALQRAGSAPPRAPAQRSSTRAQARAQSSTAAPASVLEATRAALKNVFAPAPQAVAAPAAAQRRGAPGGRSAAKSAIPEAAFNETWWDGTWSVITTDATSNNVIVVKNLEFTYNGDAWRINREGNSWTMRWPHQPTVIQRLKHADKAQIVWEATFASGAFITILWQKDAVKTRGSMATGVIVGGKGSRDVPLRQGNRKRMLGKRSSEALAPLVAAHPAGVPGAVPAPGAEAAARPQEGPAKSRRAGRPWPARAAGTY